jgi:DNA-binding response OmpR family regulator
VTKILVAEDERDIRELIAFTLRFAQFEVVLARNGVEAIELAEREKPDLIILDVRMPKMTGYEACRRIKEKPDIQGTPIIFLSAKGQDAEVQQGLESGAEEYILKPFVPDELVAQVRDVIRKAGISS